MGKLLSNIFRLINSYLLAELRCIDTLNICNIFDAISNLIMFCGHFLKKVNHYRLNFLLLFFSFLFCNFSPLYFRCPKMTILILQNNDNPFRQI